MSGLSRTPGKRVWVNPHRGFESRLLRQKNAFSTASNGSKNALKAPSVIALRGFFVFDAFLEITHHVTHPLGSFQRRHRAVAALSPVGAEWHYFGENGGRSHGGLGHPEFVARLGL